VAGVDTYLVCGWLRLRVSVAHPVTKGRYTSDHEYLYLLRICATEQPYAGVCMCRSMVACGRNSSEHSWSGRGLAWRCRVCGRVATTCSVVIHASSHFSTSLSPNVSQNFNLPKLYTHTHVCVQIIFCFPCDWAPKNFVFDEILMKWRKLTSLQELQRSPRSLAELRRPTYKGRGGKGRERLGRGG